MPRLSAVESLKALRAAVDKSGEAAMSLANAFHTMIFADDSYGQPSSMLHEWAHTYEVGHVYEVVPDHFVPYEPPLEKDLMMLSTEPIKLMNPTPLQIGQNARAIARGEMIVVRDLPPNATIAPKPPAWAEVLPKVIAQPVETTSVPTALSPTLSGTMLTPPYILFDPSEADLVRYAEHIATGKVVVVRRPRPPTVTVTEPLSTLPEGRAIDFHAE